MDVKLFSQAIAKFLGGLLMVGILLFLPAGSFGYWQGWLLMGILFIPMFIAGLIMMKKSPDLLRKRLDVKEQQAEQKTVIALSGVTFLAAFVVAGLNFRLQWIVLPAWVSWAAAVVFLLAYALYAEVLRENVWLSRTIEVQENQKVIDTGLYGIVCWAPSCPSSSCWPISRSSQNASAMRKRCWKTGWRDTRST